MKNTLAQSFMGNSMFLGYLLNGLNNDDMLLKTGQSNTIGWILGHMVLSRGTLLKKLSSPVEIKDLENRFARGAAKDTDVKVDLQQILNDFACRGDEIVKILEQLKEEDLKMDIGVELPSGGRDLESYLSFTVWHETFHMGQIDLIMAAAGKGGIN